MGMSTTIVGFLSDENETYKKHAKVLEACIEAGISELPKETAEYFCSKDPDASLLYEVLEIEIPVKEIKGSYDAGF